MGEGRNAGQMENEQMVLEGFEQRIADLESRLSEVEKRLEGQERKARRASQFQQLQEAEIQKLKEIALSLASEEPLRSGDGAAAISKETAYQRFEECGVGKVTAMRALRKAGVLRLDRAGRNTTTIWLNGKCQRVIIVTAKENTP